MVKHIKKSLGKVVSGSINSGIKVIIERDEIIEDFPLGAIVSVLGKKYRYLAMITDTGLESQSDFVGSMIVSRIPVHTRDISINSIRDQISKRWLELVLISQASNENAKTADTTPSFYSDIIEATEDEIKYFFGVEDSFKKWNIGAPKTPKEVKVEIPIDVEKLVELSFGIFGKSGTGKTFLGNILAGYIAVYDAIKANKDPQAQRIRLLIFDMHSEYSLELRDNMGNPIARGIANIFSDRFKRYTPDVELADKRGLHLLKINYSELTVDDIRLIAPVFGVTTTFLNYLYDYEKILKRKLGDLWVWGFILDNNVASKLEKTEEGRRILNEIQKQTGKNDFDEIRKDITSAMKELGAGLHSFKSQTSKLKALINYPFTCGKSSIDDIVDNLISRDGQSIVISFGKYEKETPLYMIIANLIARRLREKIIDKSVKGEEIETKIIIFLEEAHNFLGKTTYRQSPFGAIAREMRKKGVMLCVIDQKPGELDSDVVSMLWTNFIFTLTDKNDIEAALIGILERNYLRR